jgi:perosamine synthetase
MIPVAKPYITNEEAIAAHDTILTGWITQGPRVAEFEENFARYTGARYAVAVSNCTMALHLAMIVAGLKEGDEVICPSLSYIATANAIKYVGAIPVFAEIIPETYNLDPADVVRNITPKTKAILLVHQIGIPADIDAFKKIAAEHDLIIIEDAACAAGSAYKGRKIGTHSSLVCFSFHPRKVISTGDGGMITTDNATYYERLKRLRQHGMSVNDRVRHESKTAIIEEYTEVGYNYRMTDIQASVGVKQLEKLDWIVSERRKIAKRYLDAWSEIDCIRMIAEPEGMLFNFQSFSIYLKDTCPIDRNVLIQKLLDAGIASRRGVMTAHRELAYKKEYSGVRLPKSEDTCDKSIIMPLYVPMNDKDVQYVIDTFSSLVRS